MGSTFFFKPHVHVHVHVHNNWRICWFRPPTYPSLARSHVVGEHTYVSDLHKINVPHLLTYSVYICITYLPMITNKRHLEKCVTRTKTSSDMICCPAATVADSANDINCSGRGLVGWQNYLLFLSWRRMATMLRRLVYVIPFLRKFHSLVTLTPTTCTWRFIFTTNPNLGVSHPVPAQALPT